MTQIAFCEFDLTASSYGSLVGICLEFQCNSEFCSTELPTGEYRVLEEVHRKLIMLHTNWNYEICELLNTSQKVNVTEQREADTTHGVERYAANNSVNHTYCNTSRSRSIEVGIEIKLRAGWSGARIPVGAIVFCLHQNFQTRSHPASYSTGTGV
jgi:hypothetical protein